MEILLGDFNAKGRENIFQPTIGTENVHPESNDNGIRLVNFVTSKNLIVKSTFPHRNIHQYTWTSPDGITHDQIDHFLVDKMRQSSIIDVRSLRGADCDTDHYLMVATIRERLSLKKEIKQHLVADTYNLNKLGDHETREEYQIDVANKFSSIDDTWVNNMDSI
jgi:hypothetical protein